MDGDKRSQLFQHFLRSILEHVYITKNSNQFGVSHEVVQSPVSFSLLFFQLNNCSNHHSKKIIKSSNHQIKFPIQSTTHHPPVPVFPSIDKNNYAEIDLVLSC